MVCVDDVCGWYVRMSFYEERCTMRCKIVLMC